MFPEARRTSKFVWTLGTEDETGRQHFVVKWPLSMLLPLCFVVCSSYIKLTHCMVDSLKCQLLLVSVTVLIGSEVP